MSCAEGSSELNDQEARLEGCADPDKRTRLFTHWQRECSMDAMVRSGCGVDAERSGSTKQTLARQQASAPSWMPCWRGMCVTSSPRFFCTACVAAPLCLRVSDFEAVCTRGADLTSRSSREELAPLRSRLF